MHNEKLKKNVIMYVAYITNIHKHNSGKSNIFTIFITKKSKQIPYTDANSNNASIVHRSSTNTLGIDTVNHFVHCETWSRVVVQLFLYKIPLRMI